MIFASPDWRRSRVLHIATMVAQGRATPATPASGRRIGIGCVRQLAVVARLRRRSRLLEVRRAEPDHQGQRRQDDDGLDLSAGDTLNYQFNPIVVDDVMYVLAKNNSLVALERGDR